MTRTFVRIARALGEIETHAPHGEARRLARSLRAFLLDLREDAMEPTLEDVDVLLEGALALDALWAGRDPGPEWDRGDAWPRVCRAPRIQRMRPVPRRRPSGLALQELADSTWISLPGLEQSAATERVLEDLNALRRQGPHGSWTLDLTHTERLPLRVLRAAATGCRRLSLAGLSSSSTSAALIGLLAWRFEID